MGNIFGKQISEEEMKLLKDQINEVVNNNSVVVYSKTYCPYCTKAKKELEKLNIKAKVIELDLLDEGSDIQQALLALTNQRTVPNIFINKTHVGGCDDLVKKIASGEVKKLLGASM
ncbi:Glutaredoxin [Zancudomyces culisetae]|uniref:Glutaredoxin n=1 Tax=Zancudomyces culisetae TaxID=1213189 RepID=A0A1R1PWZ1_ZANCU|nr:Glutaredoxin [Zancudomyces culisetae]|eukprot:OMH85505.1 Glutaredoxin [Zancudomyces culisetae]